MTKTPPTSASLDDPQTWEGWGRPDPEFAKMMEDQVPRRFPPVDLSRLAYVRQAWADQSGSDMMTMLEQAKDGVSHEEIYIPVRDGSTMRSLVFRPKAPVSPAGELEGRPLVVLIHGGGFLFGTPEMEAAACIGVTQKHGCVSLSLSYRLSPEVKFPVAYEDCWDAVQWITSHAAELGADPSKGFILGGTSSGGQTAAALSHWARDNPLSMSLTGLYLNVPATVPEPSAVPEKYISLYRSRTRNNPSQDGNKKDGRAGLSEKTQSAFEVAVAPEKDSELWNPLNWRNGHHGLPPTYFQVCGADILRDDALIYERVLRLEYGIETKVDIYPGLPHVFWYLYPGHSAYAKFFQDTIRGLEWLLHKRTNGP